MCVRVYVCVCTQYIKQGDVLMEFNGVPIANDATVHLRQRERIYFSSLITMQPTGQEVSVKLLRNGQVGWARSMRAGQAHTHAHRERERERDSELWQ